MTFENIYDFLSYQCKYKSVRVESLPKILNIPRTTLYRYMKGFVVMPEGIIEKFIEVLRMSTTEQMIFHELISITCIDPTLVKARQVVDRIIYQSSLASTQLPDKDFIFYHDKVEIYSFRELWRHLHSLFCDPQYNCRIKLLNCTNDRFFASAVPFLESALNSGAQQNSLNSIEHIVQFSSDDYERNVSILEKLFHLLLYNNYHVYINETSAPTDSVALLSNVMLVDISPVHSQEDLPSMYFIISFLDNAYSECYTSNNPYFYKMMSNHFNYMRTSSTKELTKSVRASDIRSGIEEKASTSDIYFIKADFCYDMIPLEAYRSLCSRCEQSALIKLVQMLFPETPQLLTLDKEALTDVLLDYLNRSIKAITKKPYTMVISKSGIQSFMDTGLLSDKVYGLPPFIEEERKMVIRYILHRMEDPKDAFRLFLSKEDIFPNHYIVFIYKNQCIEIQYQPSYSSDSRLSDHFIENPMLEEAFIDYIENQLPLKHTLAYDEVKSFLESFLSE